MNDKVNRKKVIADLIRSQRIHTQEEFLQELLKRGINITQATLSRDIRELGAIKRGINGVTGSFYELNDTSSIHRCADVTRIEISGQLCVLHSKPGFASVVAAHLDDANISGVMGTIAGDDTVLAMLSTDCQIDIIENKIRNLFGVSKVIVHVANSDDLRYVESICHELLILSHGRNVGVACRSKDYIREKILANHAVIAISEVGELVGFSYVESWKGKNFVANSGLFVVKRFRNMGVGHRIKEMVFDLSRKLYPNAKILSVTTGAAVMKMNYDLGFHPVPFTSLTQDPDFWSGCKGCSHYDILKSHNCNMCICTGLLYDPKSKIERVDNTL